MFARGEIMFSKLPLMSLFCGIFLGSPFGRAQDSFKPAQFAGIQVGRDTLAVARLKLGQPTEFFRDRSGTNWVYYSDVGPIQGKVEIQANSKTGVIGVVNVFPRSLLAKNVKDHFGPRFRVIRYDLCEAGLIESENGASKLLMYSEKGIAIQLDGESVSYISYLSKAPNIGKSRCPDP